MNQTTIKKYTIKELNDFIFKNAIEFEKEAKIKYYKDELLDHLLSEANQTMLGLLDAEGFSFDRTTVQLDFNEDKLARIDHLFWMLNESYEGIFSGADIYEDVFGCSGDDDIDYNGTYLEGVIEMIKFAKNKGL